MELIDSVVTEYVFDWISSTVSCFTAIKVILGHPSIHHTLQIETDGGSGQVRVVIELPPLNRVLTSSSEKTLRLDTREDRKDFKTRQ